MIIVWDSSLLKSYLKYIYGRTILRAFKRLSPMQSSLCTPGYVYWLIPPPVPPVRWGVAPVSEILVKKNRVKKRGSMVKKFLGKILGFIFKVFFMASITISMATIRLTFILTEIVYTMLFIITYYKYTHNLLYKQIFYIFLQINLVIWIISCMFALY